MKLYQCTEKPFSLHGLRHIDPEQGKYWRLTPEIMEAMPQYEQLGRRSGGGRLRFQTDSPFVFIRYQLKTLSVDVGMSIRAASGLDVYYGTGKDARFGGFVSPEHYEQVMTPLEKKLEKGAGLDTVTINLPRNEQLAFLEIGLAQESTVSAAPYTRQGEIIFYGSSITEGGCATRPGTAYTHMLSRWLDIDFRTYGFSGSAKGELDFAAYIADHDNMSLFVYDYDHNSPSPEHLAATHEPFFKVVRGAHPTLPIIMMSRPDFTGSTTDVARRSVVLKTYLNALESGDENVYFIDGEDFFFEDAREESTVDGCHPNTLGFYSMAKRIYPRARDILDKRQQL